ncbi:MAG: hypothetical protein SCK29_03570 [Bacillota bacterium]|nr:hypothetical protein [Bacillota bacterium]MDW7683184.1 hypothetical protein [Bacillota bacterium]
MSERFWQRFADMGKDGGPQKSTLFLLALAVVGIVFMFVSANPEAQSPAPQPQPAAETLAVAGKGDYRQQLERELADRLGRVRGVRDVSVLITLESGPTYEYEQDRQTTERSTHEADGAGGLRDVEETTTQTQAVITRDNSAEKAVVKRELHPRIAGVMVIAQGAENPVIKEQITLAVAAALNLPAHRIRVLPME